MRITLDACSSMLIIAIGKWYQRMSLIGLELDTEHVHHIHSHLALILTMSKVPSDPWRWRHHLDVALESKGGGLKGETQRIEVVHRAVFSTPDTCVPHGRLRRETDR